MQSANEPMECNQRSGSQVVISGAVRPGVARAPPPRNWVHKKIPGCAVELKVKVKFSRTRYRALGPELIPVLCSQPAGDVSHKPGGRLPLLSARPAVTPATLKSAATSFAAWRTEAQWVWTVCLRLLPDSVKAAIWTQALLRLSPARYRATRQNDSFCVIFALCTTVLCRRALMRLIFHRSIVWLCHQLRLHFKVTQVSFTAHELNWSDLN